VRKVTIGKKKSKAARSVRGGKRRGPPQGKKGEKIVAVVPCNIGYKGVGGPRFLSPFLQRFARGSFPARCWGRRKGEDAAVSVCELDERVGDLLLSEIYDRLHRNTKPAGEGGGGGIP